MSFVQPLGLHNLYWREGRLHPVRIEFKEGHLLAWKKNNIVRELIENEYAFNERTVQLVKSDNKIGLQIQGGVENDLPIRIHHIFKDSVAEQCGQLHVNDIILHVNDETALNKEQGAVVKMISDSEDILTIHVVSTRKKKKIPLTLNDREMVEEEEEDVVDLQNAIGDVVDINIADISLTFAILTRYYKGNNILIPNAFKLSASGGLKPKLTLHCSQDYAHQIVAWSDLISQYIVTNNEHEVERLREYCDLQDLVFAGWIHELLPSSQISKTWLRKFLVLRNDTIQIFDQYPDSVELWQRPERTHKIYEIYYRSLDDDMTDIRSCSILIQTANGDNHTISFEFPIVYDHWMKLIEKTRYSAVEKLMHQSFKAYWNKRYVNLILDLDKGFIIEDNTTKEIHWEEPFSHLKSSTDNGHQKLHLEFINHTEDIEVHDLLKCLYTMDAFITTKVIQADH